MKITKPTMDSMLRFLDAERWKIAAFYCDETPDRLSARIAAETERVTKRYQSLATHILEITAACGDSALEWKAKQVAEALHETALPECSITRINVEAQGRWHCEASVNVGERRFGRTRRVLIGTADYALTTGTKRVSLDTDQFDDALGLPTGYACYGDETNEELTQTAVEAFRSWLTDVDPDLCRTGEGKQWLTQDEEHNAPIYFFCLPRIGNLSSAIKRLRRFEKAFAGRVYVCLADPEEARTLHDQGFGTCVYPSGQLTGWPIERQPASYEDIGFLSSWAKLCLLEGKLRYEAY